DGDLYGDDVAALGLRGSVVLLAEVHDVDAVRAERRTDGRRRRRLPGLQLDLHQGRDLLLGRHASPSVFRFTAVPTPGRPGNTAVGSWTPCWNPCCVGHAFERRADAAPWRARRIHLSPSRAPARCCDLEALPEYRSPTPEARKTRPDYGLSGAARSG